MFEFLTYAMWFSFGLLIGGLITYAWVERCTAISFEEAANLTFTEDN